MTDDVLSLMEEDASDSLNVPADNYIRSVSNLAEAMLRWSGVIKDLEERLSHAKGEFNRIAEEDLPQLMIEVGIAKIELETGETVEVKPTYGAHIKAANKPEAFQWLRENNLDDIIKNTVSLAFGRGEDDRAREFIDVATAAGHVPDQKTDIHPQTLKAWVRERIEGGESIPMELFGVFAGQRATIKRKN